MILARPGALAARCARLGQVLGGNRYFPGACEITANPSSCAEAAQWASRLQPSPRTALATYLGDTGEQQILIDPLTDMPAVHTRDGAIETLAPQRLPTISPLATHRHAAGRHHQPSARLWSRTAVARSRVRHTGRVERTYPTVHPDPGRARESPGRTRSFVPAVWARAIGTRLRSASARAEGRFPFRSDSR